VFTTIYISCGSKTETSETWDEMDKFHLVMAECFHPYKDSSNLEPAKRLASEMSLSAEKWSMSPLPTPVDSDEVKGMLGELNRRTKEFAEMVKGDDDEQIANSLTEIHDLFHHLQEAWYNARSGDHHDDEHHH
jgi:hypothetical protein